MLNESRILVCEDDLRVAAFLEDTLAAEGATILGPVTTVEGAMELLWSNVHIDAAVVDLHLFGEMSFPVAEKLVRYRVPILFCTGADNVVLPGRYRSVPILLKPFGPSEVISAVSTLIEKDAMKLAMEY